MQSRILFVLGVFAAVSFSFIKLGYVQETKKTEYFRAVDVNDSDGNSIYYVDYGKNKGQLGQVVPGEVYPNDTLLLVKAGSSVSFSDTSGGTPITYEYKGGYVYDLGDRSKTDVPVPYHVAKKDTDQGEEFYFQKMDYDTNKPVEGFFVKNPAETQMITALLAAPELIKSLGDQVKAGDPAADGKYTAFAEISPVFGEDDLGLEVEIGDITIVSTKEVEKAKSSLDKNKVQNGLDEPTEKTAQQKLLEILVPSYKIVQKSTKVADYVQLNTVMREGSDGTVELISAQLEAVDVKLEKTEHETVQDDPQQQPPSGSAP